MLIAENRLILLKVLIFCLLFDSCKLNNQDQTLSPSAKTPQKVYKALNIINKDTDLSISLVDSVAKEVILFYGSKNDNGYLKLIKQVKGFSATSNVGAIINFNETSSLIGDLTLFSTSTSISIKFIDINISELKFSYTITNNNSGKIILTKKDAPLSQEIGNKLTASQLTFTNIKNARVSYSPCQFATQAVAALQNTACILALIEFSAITAETGGLDLLVGGVAVLFPCWDAVNQPLLSQECPAVEPKDLPGLASDCLPLLLGEIKGSCINTLLQYYLKLGSNILPVEENKQVNNPSNSGGGYGDPHVKTFDGLYYDFQGYGEFIAVKSMTDNFEIQIRQEQIAPYLNRQVTMHTGLAINTGNDKVCVYPDRIYINSKLYGFGNDIIPLAKGKVSYSNGVVVVVTDNDDVIKVNIRSLASPFLDYTVTLNNNRKGSVKGLLGNFDGNFINDTQLQSGNIINPYIFSSIYPTYADSWRISQEKSLFVYTNGTSTATYSKMDFPKSQTELDAVARQQAETICRQKGVTDEPYLSACILDVALSGSDRYAVSAIGAQELKSVSTSFLSTKFTTFDDAGLIPFGNAEISDGLLYLTRNKSFQVGAVYEKYKVEITNGFETTFDFSMTDVGGIRDARNRVGADGIVFIVQDFSSKDVPLASGVGLGYDGLPRSLAVEFDTYNNGSQENQNDISLNTQGISPNSVNDSRTLIKAQTRQLPTMNDGKVHNVVIRYTKKTEGIYKLEVYFDKDTFPYLTADDINIQNTIGAYGTGVYIGLTSATGYSWENHIIHNWTFKPL